MGIRVVIADEMDLTLAGMQALLRHHHYHLVGAYSQLSALLAGVAHTRPQVILLSDRLEPDLDPLSLIEQVRAVTPHARIILTSPFAGGLIVHEALNAGANAFLYKNDPLREEIVRAIEVVMRHRSYISPTPNSAYLVATQAGGMRWRFDTESRDVLYRLAQGLRAQEIALRRGAPVRRIYWVIQKLRYCFAAETNEQLMVHAAEEGFLPRWVDSNVPSLIHHTA